MSTPEARNFPFTKAEILYAQRDPSADVNKLLGRIVPVTLVPKMNLFGTQTRFEYDGRKERDIKCDFKNDPDLLSEHPIIACALPAFPIESVDDFVFLRDGGEYRIAVTDGHHRVRFSPHSIVEVPTRILTVIETLIVHRNLQRLLAHTMPYRLQATYETIRSWSDETIHSFVDTTDKPGLMKYNARIGMQGDVPVIL